MITSHLSSIEVSLLFPDGGAFSVDAGTAKPVVKGRQMYVSQRLTLVEYASTSTHLYFRANCDASMRDRVLYPGVALTNEGEVDYARCSCEARADQRCAHVACLLYLMEDLALKQEPKISRPSTSPEIYF